MCMFSYSSTNASPEERRSRNEERRNDEMAANRADSLLLCCGTKKQNLSMKTSTDTNKKLIGKNKLSQNWRLLLQTGSAATSCTASEDKNMKKRTIQSFDIAAKDKGSLSSKRSINQDFLKEPEENSKIKPHNLPPSTNYVGLDCEMVGVGPSGRQSALARACIVDFHGDVLYDRYVRPKGFVTDFRTKYSGVRSSNLRKGEACSFEECQRNVAELIKGKILVGHALKNDLTVLMLSHPRAYIRDTASYRPLMKCRKVGDKEKYCPNALRNLAKEKLGITIQDGEHDPGVDARTAMMLYRECRLQWEQSLTEATKKAYSAVGVKRKSERKEDLPKEKGNALLTEQVAKRKKPGKNDSRKYRVLGKKSAESLFGAFEDFTKLRSIDDVDQSK